MTGTASDETSTSEQPVAQQDPTTWTRNEWKDYISQNPNSYTVNKDGTYTVTVGKKSYKTKFGIGYKTNLKGLNPRDTKATTPAYVYNSGNKIYKDMSSAWVDTFGGNSDAIVEINGQKYKIGTQGHDVDFDAWKFTPNANGSLNDTSAEGWVLKGDGPLANKTIERNSEGILGITIDNTFYSLDEIMAGKYKF